MAGLGALMATLALLTGCGQSSPSLTGSIDIPNGYSRYHGPGYSLIYPTGWRQSPYQSNPTESGTEFVGPGSTPGNAYPYIQTELAAPRAGLPAPASFSDFVANLQDEATTILVDGHPIVDAVSVKPVNVPGASEARLVTMLGRGSRHELDLIAHTRAGVVQITVAWFPAHEPLKPRTVIDSLRLTG